MTRVEDKFGNSRPLAFNRIMKKSKDINSETKKNPSKRNKFREVFLCFFLFLYLTESVTISRVDITNARMQPGANAHAYVAPHARARVTNVGTLVSFRACATLLLVVYRGLLLLLPGEERHAFRVYYATSLSFSRPLFVFSLILLCLLALVA